LRSQSNFTPSFMSTEIKEDKDEWAENLYSIDLVDDAEFKDWVGKYSYNAFNRKKVLKQLKEKFPDPKEAAEAIVICAMKGPQRAAVTKMKNGKTIESFGIPASRTQGTDFISCQRIVAATADLAAFYLKRMDFPKRVNSTCPGWLQFPSAGSIILPDELRTAHIEFSRKFSPMIGGVFNEQIYQQMMMNAYLNPRLKLFDPISATTHLEGLTPTNVVSITPSIVQPSTSASSSASKRKPP